MSAPQDAERNESRQEFPQDEFDEIPYDARYYGTHRKALPQVRQRNSLKWVQLAGALALLIGAFSFLILPTLLGQGERGSDKPTAAETETTQSQSPTETETKPSPTDESPTATTEESPSDEQTTPSETATPDEEETTPAANIDYQQNVEVYSTVAAAPGAAAQGSQTLRNQGFTVAVTGTWQGFAVASSTVYYATDGQKDTAEAIAAALNISNVEQRQVPAIVVVLAGN